MTALLDTTKRTVIERVRPVMLIVTDVGEMGETGVMSATMGRCRVGVHATTPVPMDTGLLTMPSSVSSAMIHASSAPTTPPTAQSAKLATTLPISLITHPATLSVC